MQDMQDVEAVRLAVAYPRGHARQRLGEAVSLYHPRAQRAQLPSSLVDPLRDAWFVAEGLVSPCPGGHVLLVMFAHDEGPVWY